MHDSQKLISFIALRANGWSLASISLEINIPKSTLWEWDTKHQDRIRRLKQLQLEKFQERFVSTYEDELARLSLYLRTIERNLEKCRFDKMSPAFLLQTALYLRSRLAHLCKQASDPDATARIGRITSHPYDQFSDDDLEVGRGVPAEPPKPDETPGGVENRSLIISHLQQHAGHPRPVLHSQTAHAETPAADSSDRPT